MKKEDESVSTGSLGCKRLSRSAVTRVSERPHREMRLLFHAHRVSRNRLHKGSGRGLRVIMRGIMPARRDDVFINPMDNRHNEKLQG